MPGVTLNHDVSAQQQFPSDPRARLQSSQEALAHARIMQTNGTPFSPTSLETFMMTLALEEDVDLSGFSMASNNNVTSQAPQVSTAELNQFPISLLVPFLSSYHYLLF
ncbi:hypothetical protein BGZ94_009498 [Podila epigama]|nr:hypothetical protein BGZ94_009498 [Podila epigama]